MFKKLDIGSAKVEKEHRAKVPHHLLDVVDIGQLFNAADYSILAEQAIQVWLLNRCEMEHQSRDLISLYFISL